MKKLLILALVASLALVLGSGLLFAAGDVFHGGDIVYTKPVKSVLFSHSMHLEKLDTSCDMCHTAIFEMQALKAQENEDFTMQSLYEGKYCGACHNGSWGFASNTQCARCHIGVKGHRALQKAKQPKEEESPEH